MKRSKTPITGSAKKIKTDPVTCPFCFKEYDKNMIDVHISFHLNEKVLQSTEHFTQKPTEQLKTVKHEDTSAFSVLMSNANKQSAIFQLTLTEDFKLLPTFHFAREIRDNYQQESSWSTVLSIKKFQYKLVNNVTQERTLKLELCTNIAPSVHSPPNTVDVIAPIHISFLKSILQKAVRRRKGSTVGA